MSAEELKSYRLNSMEEPTDEMLEAIMLGVQETARKTTAKAKAELEQSETKIRANILTSYAGVLVLEDVVALLDSSLNNIERLAEMTQRSVEVGAAEQTAADQIQVRVNTLRNNINANRRSTQLAKNALKVPWAVPL